MARRVRKIRNADLAVALLSGLEQGLLTVSDAIYVMRALEGFSQRALAERAGVTTNAIKAIESGGGNPLLDTLSRIAKAYKLRIAFVSERGSIGLMNPRAVDSHRKTLSDSDISAILETIPGQANIVLVGEVALKFWAEALGISRESQDGPGELIVNSGIEILGSAMSALEFARAAGGSVELAVMEDEAKSSTALVTVNIGEQAYFIRFLCGMQGFWDEELEGVRQSAMPVGLNPGRQGRILMMHAVHCLREQLETVCGYPLSRRKEPGGERYIARVELALEACRRITLRHLKQGDIDGAQSIVEKVHSISLLPAALRARVQDAVCVDHGIVDSEAFPKDFRERRLRQFQRALTRKIYRYRRTYGSGAHRNEA